MGIALWYCPKKNSPLYMELRNLMISLQSLFVDAPDISTPHITITSGLDLKDSKKILNTVVAALKSTIDHNKSVNSHSSKTELMPKKNRTASENKVATDHQDPDLRLSTTPVLNFTRLSIGPTFFTRIKLDIDKEHNKVLLSLVKLIRDMYVSNTTESGNADFVINEYKPHVSLVYSDLVPSRAEYLNIVTRLEDAVDCKIDVENGAIIDTQPGSDQFKNSIDPSLLSNSWNMTNGTFMVVKCVGPIEKWEIIDTVDI